MSLTNEDGDPAQLRELVDRAVTLDSHAVAQLVSIFQDRRPAAAAQRQLAIELLDQQRGDQPEAAVIGITGTPGSGKSTLIGRVAGGLLRQDERLSIAVLAVDPSSRISGGALLGDRTRLDPSQIGQRLFFRSEASDTALGGLSPSSFQVCRLLTKLYRCVIVETVGIGQSEADIRDLADHVLLVMAPLGGDEIQFLKAGIIEIPDAFVVNKCDEAAAETSFRQLQSSLGMARPFDGEQVPIFRTSAKTGAGLEELETAITKMIEGDRPARGTQREAHFFEKWVREEWGRAGVRKLDELGGAELLISQSGGVDAAQAALTRQLNDN